jgi:hypothetical protein
MLLEYSPLPARIVDAIKDDAIVGRLIDHLSARAGAHRDIAAARKDHVAADHQARTPIPTPGQ